MQAEWTTESWTNPALFALSVRLVVCRVWVEERRVGRVPSSSVVE